MELATKIIEHPDGKRRVLIVRRENGMFGFEVEVWSDEPRELCWLSCSQAPFGIYDTEETAEFEARSRVDWLKQMDVGSRV